MVNVKTVHIIGIPSDLGQYRSGARFGPRAFIATGVMKAVSGLGYRPSYFNLFLESAHPEDFDAKRPSRALIEHKKKIIRVGMFAARYVYRAHHNDALPVIVGGDNVFSAFTISQTIRSNIREGQTTGLLWIDAHLDAHTEKTSPSHHAHGMPLAALLGYGALRYRKALTLCVPDGKGDANFGTVSPYLPPDRALEIGVGAADVEDEERALLAHLGVPVFDLARLRSANGWSQLYEVIDDLASRVDRIVVMIDLDVFHSTIAPGVYYRSANGLLPSEWPELIDKIRGTKKVAHIELMELCPERDERDARGDYITATLARDILLCLLKK